jgi:hypothetical protein
MDVLSLLKPGGSFLYAPGLAFVEALLRGEEYSIELFAIASMSGSRTEKYFRRAGGLDVLYASEGTRIAD